MYLKELLKIIPSYERIQVYDAQNSSLLYYDGVVKFILDDELLKNYKVDFLEIDYDGEDAYLAIGVLKDPFAKEICKHFNRISEILNKWGIKSEDEGDSM